MHQECSLGQRVSLDAQQVSNQSMLRNRLAAAQADFAHDMPEWARWFTVSVATDRENLVADEMGECGIEAWVPQVTEPIFGTVKRGGRPPSRIITGYRTLEALPGYLLVWVVPSALSFEAINSFKNVIGVLRYGGAADRKFNSERELHLAALPNKVVERMRGLQDTEFDLSTGLEDRFKPGDKVRITYGWSLGFQGIVSDRRSFKGTVNVDIDAMGRKVTTQCWLDDLELVA